MNQSRPSLIRRAISRLANQTECASDSEASTTEDQAAKSNMNPALRGTLIATKSATQTPSDSAQTRRATNAARAFAVARVCVFLSIACVLLDGAAAAYAALAVFVVGLVAILAAGRLSAAQSGQEA